MLDLWSMRQLHLFDGLAPAEIDEVLQMMVVRPYSAGAFIFSPPEAHDRLYLLHQGKVKIYLLTAQGREKLLHILVPGDAFGGLLLGGTVAALPHVQALEDVVVSSMDEEAFKRFMRAYPELCMNIFRYMTHRHAADLQRLETLLHTKMDVRLVHTLLELGERLGRAETEQLEVDSFFTHEELANLIGASRTTVSELISQLRRAGVLGGKGRRLVVHRGAAEQFLRERERSP